jgi:hypothetical protein
MGARQGLSFEQAPPFSLPLRFFLSAPLFLFVAGALIAVSPQTLADRWTPAALAMTHAVTLGFLAMVMLGALLQMLPVVAGAVFPAARVVAAVSHVTLAAGTLALIAGFVTGAPGWLVLAASVLAAGFAVFLVAAAVSLVRAQASTTVSGIRLAAASLLVTVLLGLALALLRAGAWSPPLADVAAAAHVTFGLVGWVLLLVIGVAYQVVPMFQLTPPYPPRLARALAGTLFVMLLLHAALPAFSPLAGRLVDGAIAAAVLLFAVATLRLQAKRRRKLADVTLDYWRLGMASLIAAVAVWGAAQFSAAWAQSDAYPVLLGVLFVGGFAVSVVNGMLYKIVPFLAWFHLQSQLQARVGSIPTMKQMIAERAMRWQFRLHGLAVALLVVGTVFPRQMHGAAGAALAASAIFLGLNLLSAVRRYRRYGGRFG